MALTNAERQARHRERIKERLRSAADPKPLRNDGDGYEAGIEAIERLLLDEYYAVAQAWLEYPGASSKSVEAAAQVAVEDFLQEELRFTDLLMMIKEQAFGRLNDHMANRAYGGDGTSREMSWRAHARDISLRNGA